MKAPKNIKRITKPMAVPKNGNGNGNNSGMMVPIGAAALIVMALLQAISYLAYNSTNSNIDRLQKELVVKAHDLEETRIREHNRIEQTLIMRVLAIEKEFLRLREHDEFTRRLDSQISKIEAKLVLTATRDELDNRLGINSNSIIQVRNEVGEMKRDLGQTYPMKEVLGNLTSRIDRMEQWSRAPPPHQLKSNQSP